MKKRIQRKRAKGWKMPEGAVYVGRPTAWGNPFPVSGDIAPWLALALGERADADGRRSAAVKAYRAWLTGEPVRVDDPPLNDSVIEFSGGTRRSMSELVRGIGMLMLGKSPVAVPQKPDLAPLRGKDLVCWCPLDKPCHADVLLELAR